jgi:uncharacterized protein involved in exopolysaccharide biosynthesis
VSGFSPLLRRAIAFAWERRWLFAVPVATLLAPAAFYVVHLPDVYRAASTISVRQVTTDRIAGAPKSQEWRPEQILGMARDRVLQTANVAMMIPVLWPKGNPDDAFTLNAARGRVLYDQAGDTRFSISLEDTDASRAAAAVNALVDAFLTSERAERVRSAEQQRDRVVAERDKAKQEYDQSLAAVQAFRSEHPDTMPDQKDRIEGELRRLDQEAHEREGDAQRNRQLIPEVDKVLRSSLPSGGADAAKNLLSADETLAQLKLTSAQAALDQAKKSLEELRLRYTDKMDVVKSAALQVESRDADVTRAKQELDAARKRGETDTSARRRADNEGLLQYLRQWRESLVAEASRLDERAAAARQEAARLTSTQARMSDTEGQLRLLTPTVDSKYQLYLSAETAARNARIAADTFRTGDPGETIGYSIEWYATPPTMPSGPARSRYLLTAVALGLLAGYGLHLVRRRYLDEDLITRPEDLAALVPGALVVSVPMLGEGPVARRIRLADVVCAMWVLACLAGAAFALGAHKGWLTPPPWFRSWLGAHA